jgi:hypothetical protein
MSKYFQVTVKNLDKESRELRGLPPFIVLDLTEYVNFLPEYFKADPLSCLEEVYSMGDFEFENTFFSAIFSKYARFLRYLPSKLGRSSNAREFVIRLEK